MENFRAAYARLASGNSTQSLTRAEAAEFSDPEKLQPTHYALKIYPKGEEEQWKIELMEDVKVAYMPFDYVGLTEDEVENLPGTKTRTGDSGVVASDEAVFPGSYRYTVTYTDLESTEGPVPDETYILPILYAVWPIDKPLPEDMEYEVDYEVFLPRYDEASTRAQGLSAGTLQALEGEAISLALGISVPERTATRANTIRTLTGYARFEDVFFWEQPTWTKSAELPMPNLKVRFQLGSSIWDTYTQSTGDFSITQAIPLAAECKHIFQHPKWKITSENSTSPITHSIGMSNKGYCLTYVSLQEATMHVAVNYFYNESHPIRTWSYDAGIRLRAVNRNGGSQGLGYFSWDRNDRNPAEITIFNDYIASSWEPNELISTVLHELGHFIHYGKRGGKHAIFSKVHGLIVESFASYVGWCLTENYYYNHLDWTRPYVGYQLSHQGRQTWSQTSTGSVYSPLFVDLFDTYDQDPLNINSYNKDPINGFLHSIMREIGIECNTWSQVKTKLQQNVGMYCTQAELNTFVAPYDYWFARN
ncbi:MAG: hypothetical protein LBV18_02620 [Alistipes sp.]|nr:hypothetical protein [Alistipes sp.]